MLFKMSQYDAERKCLCYSRLVKEIELDDVVHVECVQWIDGIYF